MYRPSTYSNILSESTGQDEPEFNRGALKIVECVRIVKITIQTEPPHSFM